PLRPHISPLFPYTTLFRSDGFVGDKDAKVFSNVSFKLHDAMMADKYTINGGTETDFTNNKWSDANFQNIKSRLVQGENTITLYEDRKSTRLNSSHVKISYA